MVLSIATVAVLLQYGFSITDRIAILLISITIKLCDGVQCAAPQNAPRRLQGAALAFCSRFVDRYKYNDRHVIYSVRNVIEHYVANGSTVCICSLDLSKAFDKMNICPV